MSQEFQIGSPQRGYVQGASARSQGGGGLGMNTANEKAGSVKWDETLIARRLAVNFFNRKYLIVVPNCNWPGNETDLLVITENMRIIDIEIKISRSDLKADGKKDKWFHHWDWKIDGPRRHDSDRRSREWPMHAWKHYYCLPTNIWDRSLLNSLPSAKSGVLLINDSSPMISVERKATANKDAKKISPEDAVDIARLASLRMWRALEQVESIKSCR